MDALERDSEHAGPEIVLVTNVPTPYRLPLFNTLSARLRARGAHLTVVFSAWGYGRRQWTIDPSVIRFDYHVLASRGYRVGPTSEQTAFLYNGLAGVLRALRPAVVVVPGFSMATLQAWALSGTRGVPYLIWSGSVAGRFESAGRRWLRSWLARQSAGGIAYGSMAKAYLLSLGIPEERIHVAINTVDTAFFARAVSEARRTMEPAETPRRLTYVGYLSARKGVHRVLDVVRYLTRERDDFVLDLVGDGDERAALEAYARAEGIADRVVFHGYRQRAELPAFLARSSGLLFQTDFDVWGLVLNEAMAAGVPCLASVHAGATHDLVEDGVTGFKVDFADCATAAGRVRWLLDNPAAAAAMGRRAQCFVEEEASIERSGSGIVEAVESALTLAGHSVHLPVRNV